MNYANGIRGNPSPHDWPGDWSDENGNYLCNCIKCGTVFIGYKRRVTCRQCAMSKLQQLGQEIEQK